MEEGKRKFRMDPLQQQQSSSKFGRKISKYVFEVGQTNSETSKPSTDTAFRVKAKKYHVVNVCSISKQHTITPSIVLCSTESILHNPILEQQLDITSGSVIKKRKVIPQDPSKIKTSMKPLIKPKKYIKVEPTIKSASTTLSQEELLYEGSGSVPMSEVEKRESLNKTDDGKSKERKKGLSSIEEKERKLIKKKIVAEEKRLRTEHDRLTQLLNDLKSKSLKVLEVQSYQKERLTLCKLKENFEMLYYYIGFKDFDLLDSMVVKLNEYFSIREKATEQLLMEDQLIMVLMKLRRNYSMHDLAHRFRVSVLEAECIVCNVILALHNVFYEQDLKQNPFPSISSTSRGLPEQFKSFPNCRVVLECVKIACEDPSTESGTAEILTSSKFDPKIKLRGVLGISSTKSVLFASTLYDNSISNTDIFKDCNMLDKLEAGDLIMADKSFEIGDYLPSSIELNVPSLSKSIMTDKQIRNLNSKARAFIGRTTMQHIRRFCILNHIPIFLNSIATQVFQLCSSLVNFQPTITTTGIRQEELE